MRTDAELHAAAMTGGVEAFIPIVERYGDAVFGVALARLGNFHDAEDVAQDVFLEAFGRLAGLKDPSRLGAWLRSIAVHKAIDRVRRRREVTHVVEAGEQVDEGPTPHGEMERQELREQVLAAVGSLSKTLRETTTLFYINGYSIAEVAAIQEVPVGTAKRRLHDARKKLQKEMIEMVEGVLRSESPREEIAERVYQMLTRYDQPGSPWDRWDEIRHKLLEIGTEGMEGFVRALESPHSPTRRFTAKMLAHTGQAQETVESLLKEALNDSNRKVRRMAFLAIHDIMAHGDENKREELMPAVLPLLRDRSKMLRRSAWYFADVDFDGFARHVPLEEAARALVEETDPEVRELQRLLLKAVLRARDEQRH